MRIITVAFATCGMLAIAAPALAGSRLAMDAAKKATRTVALNDISEWDSYPTYTGIGRISCSRRSATKVVCRYNAYERLTGDPDGPAHPKSCDREVTVVKKRSGRITTDVENLGCTRR